MWSHSPGIREVRASLKVLNASHFRIFCENCHKVPHIDVLCFNSSWKAVSSEFLDVLGKFLGTQFLNCYGNSIQITKEFVKYPSPNTWEFLFCEKYKSILYVSRKWKKKKLFYSNYRGNLIVFLTSSSHTRLTFIILEINLVLIYLSRRNTLAFRRQKTLILDYADHVEVSCLPNNTVLFIRFLVAELFRDSRRTSLLILSKFKRIN